MGCVTGIVKDQKHAFSRQRLTVLTEHGARVFGRAELRIKRLNHLCHGGVRFQRIFIEAEQVDLNAAVRELASEPTRHVHGQGRLADATNTCYRGGTFVLFQRLVQSLDIGLTAGEVFYISP